MDVHSEEISIEPGTFIGIVHPSQLDDSLLEQWKEQFFNLSTGSIFPQLERKMSDINGIDLSKTIITKFEGRQMVQGPIKNTLERHGWHKGSTGDGGMFESFNLLYSEGKMEAILEIEGVGRWLWMGW